MSRKSNRGLSKKGIENLIRITDSEKKRKWLYQGKEYDTLREVVSIHNRQKAIELLAKGKKNKKKEVANQSD